MLAVALVGMAIVALVSGCGSRGAPAVSLALAMPAGRALHGTFGGDATGTWTGFRRRNNLLTITMQLAGSPTTYKRSGRLFPDGTFTASSLIPPSAIAAPGGCRGGDGTLSRHLDLGALRDHHAHESAQRPAVPAPSPAPSLARTRAMTLTSRFSEEGTVEIVGRSLPPVTVRTNGTSMSTVRSPPRETRALAATASAQ